jgi:hypothetical protein
MLAQGDTLDKASDLCRERMIETYFHRNLAENKLEANAVLVDMEPKVVNKCLYKQSKSSETLQWEYNPESSFFKQGGSGNNWALGHSYFA